MERVIEVRLATDAREIGSGEAQTVRATSDKLLARSDDCRAPEVVSAARRVGRVDVSALAEALGVTAETVRRDLTLLERRGTLHRVHGGAIPVERIEAEPALATRATRKAAETGPDGAIPSHGTLALERQHIPADRAAGNADPDSAPAPVWLEQQA